MSRRNEIKSLEDRVSRLEEKAGIKPVATPKPATAEASGSAAARSTSKIRRRKKATKKSEG